MPNIRQRKNTLKKYHYLLLKVLRKKELNETDKYIIINIYLFNFN